MPILREDQAVISVGFPGGPNLPYIFSWSYLSGGDLESEDTKTRPGGMLSQVNLGGPTQRTDATVRRPWTPSLYAYLVQLENVTGRQAMRISYTPLDSTGSASGQQTYTMTGILKTVTRPNYDANNAAASFLQLLMGCDVGSTMST